MKKYDNVFNIVVEGPDGVGKSTLIKNIFDYYNYRYMCYHRGEISNYFYAKKYNRPFFATQRGLPFLYIVLSCSKNELQNRIIQRAEKENWSDNDLKEELLKVDDNKEFKHTAQEMTNDYFIKIIDTSNLNEKEVFEKVRSILDSLNKNRDDPLTYSPWNKLYENECKKLGKKFYVINNQPYIDDIPIMVESTCHNGTYETFSDKRYPDNLIYAMSYENQDVKKEKKYDFHYIINSKIERRPEIFDYYEQFDKRGLKFITSSYDKVINKNYKNSVQIDRLFGEKFIDKLAECRATVYCARDLEYLKLQTAREYEAIIANNILFVDILSDKDCEILTRIHDTGKLINLLYVTPDTICENYKIIIDNHLEEKILNNQRSYYNELCKELK